MTHQAPDIVDEDEIPRAFNAASYYVDRHVAEGRGGKTAFIDAGGAHSYGDLARMVNRVASALTAAGVRPESRVAMVMLDSVHFPATFFGAIKAGIVPVAVNTLLTAEHYRYILGDCRAQVLFVSEALYDTVAPVLPDLGRLEKVVVVVDVRFEIVRQDGERSIGERRDLGDGRAHVLHCRKHETLASPLSVFHGPCHRHFRRYSK